MVHLKLRYQGPDNKFVIIETDKKALKHYLWMTESTSFVLAQQYPRKNNS
jgi:hypothetical protein